MRFRDVTSLLVLVVLLLMSVGTAPAWALTQTEIADRLRQSSYRLFVQKLSSTDAKCSGAFVDWPKQDPEEGYTHYLTAAHCVSNHKDNSYVVSRNGLQYYRAFVLHIGWEKNKYTDEYANKKNDWALLRVEGEFETLPVATSPNLSFGSHLYAYSYPLGGDVFFALGVVSNPSYAANSTNFKGYIASDIFSQGGSSGSVVVNRNGEAVAVISAGTRAGDNFTLLLPIDRIELPTNEDDTDS